MGDCIERNYELRDINGKLIMDTISPLSLESLSLKREYASVGLVDSKVDKEEFNREIRKLRRDMLKMTQGKYVYISNKRRYE